MRHQHRDEPNHRTFEPEAGFLGWGYWSALVCGGGAVAYGVGALLIGVFAAEAITWESFDRFVTDYSPLPTLILLLPAFVTAVVFPVLALAVYTTLRQEREPFGLAALLFAGVYTVVLGADYWLQLTNVPWNIARGTTEGLAPWVIWNPASLFWSFEAFGYFALGISCVFLGLAHDPGALPRRLHRSLMAMGALGVLFLLNNFKDLAVEVIRPDGWEAIEGLATASALSLVLLWVVLFGFVSFSFAGWFTRLRSKGSPASPQDPVGSEREGSP